MTITFKPLLQMQFSMLLAATRGSQPPAAAFTQRFLLATVPIPEPEAIDSKLHTNHQQLAIWDGRQLLLCALYPGVDPSQRRIDLTVNRRTLLLHGASSAMKLTSLHQQQVTQAEEGGRRLAARQPELVADGHATAVLLQGRAGVPLYATSTSAAIPSNKNEGMLAGNSAYNTVGCEIVLFKVLHQALKCVICRRHLPGCRDCSTCWCWGCICAAQPHTGMPSRHAVQLAGPAAATRTAEESTSTKSQCKHTGRRKFSTTTGATASACQLVADHV